MTTQSTTSAIDAFLAKFGNDPILDTTGFDLAAETTIQNATVSYVSDRMVVATFRPRDTKASLFGFEIANVMLIRDGDDVLVEFKAEGDWHCLRASQQIPAAEHRVHWGMVETNAARAAHLILEWWV